MFYGCFNSYKYRSYINIKCFVEIFKRKCINRAHNTYTCIVYKYIYFTKFCCCSFNSCFNRLCIGTIGLNGKSFTP